MPKKNSIQVKLKMSHDLWLTIFIILNWSNWNDIITEVEDGIEVEDEAEVVEEAGEGAILEADEVEEEEADDEGTGAPHVDITSYFPEAQVSAGKVSEVLVSVKVKFHSKNFVRPKFYNLKPLKTPIFLPVF